MSYYSNKGNHSNKLIILQTHVMMQTKPHIKSVLFELPHITKSLLPSGKRGK